MKRKKPETKPDRSAYRARYYAAHAETEKRHRMEYYWKFLAPVPFTRSRNRKGEHKKQPLRLFLAIRRWLREAGYRQCSRCRRVDELSGGFYRDSSWCRDCRHSYMAARLCPSKR